MKSEYDFSKGKRGPVIPVPKGKTRITIRLDTDLIDWFRSQVEAAGGGNYQTLINFAPRNYVREVTSKIAEERARYGSELAIREFGPTAAEQARSERAARKPFVPGAERAPESSPSVWSMTCSRALTRLQRISD